MTCSRPEERRPGFYSQFLQPRGDTPDKEDTPDRPTLPVERENWWLTNLPRWLIGQIMILQAIGFAGLAFHSWQDRETLSAMLSAIGIGSEFPIHLMLASAAIMSGILAWVLLQPSTRTEPAKENQQESR